MIIRKAIVADIPYIVDVNTKTWRTTYEGLINESTLLKQERFRLDRIKSMEHQLTKMVIEAFKVRMAVVEVDAKIVGFVSYGALRKDQIASLDRTAEIYALYVLKDVQGQGCGKALFSFVIEDLNKTDAFDDLLIWTLSENPSRRFYRKMGGQASYKRTIEIAGQRLEETGYLYKGIFR